MSKKPKLEKCPHCGKKAYIIQRKNGMYDIGCKSLCCFGWACLDKKCDCTDGYVKELDAINAWNTRNDK